MRSWRQILGYRVEPDLPNGFGKIVIAKSEIHRGGSYAGVCIYQDEDITYAVWPEEPTGDDDSLQMDLMGMREMFEENKEHYLEEVQKALAIPALKGSTTQHSALSNIKPNISWLYTNKCKFIEE